MREINKAYIGFYGTIFEDEDKNKDVATGKWGCGAFGGNPQLKFLIQWLAASKATRKMIFCTLNEPLLEKANEVLIRYKGKTIGNLFQDILDWSANREDTKDVFKYILNN